MRAPRCWQTLWKPLTPPSRRRLMTIVSPSSLPDDVIAGIRKIFGSADDLPAAVEDLAPLLFEPSRVGVDR